MSKKRRKIRFENIFLIILIITALLMVAAFALNIRRISNTDTGEGETIEETAEPENEFRNEFYSIGYNATEISKEYFRELNAALDAEHGIVVPAEGEDAQQSTDEPAESEDPAPAAPSDRADTAAAVVKCFITEYYTWTNKDGNYDIGGMQYIYTDKQSDFEQYTRFNFYKDMDLYLTQYGRDTLIEVKDVTITGKEKTDSFTAEDGTVMDCYKVTAEWSYVEGSSMDTSAIQYYATFLVADHNGRLEIVSIYE